MDLGAILQSISTLCLTLISVLKVIEHKNQ